MKRTAWALARAAVPSILVLVQAACAAGRLPAPIVAETVNPKDGSALVRIPAGAFRMGSPGAEGNLNEHPAHEVDLDAYYIGKYEVTVAQFARYCRENGREAPGQAGHGERAPVVNVTWTDAEAYCGWAGLRLPTEAEWEKAARGGSAASYWWGDVATHDMANYTGRGGRDSWDDVSPAGSFPANPYGVHDTAGNVWEWCLDRYAADYYAGSPPHNPRGPAEGQSRVLRGGSWDSPADFIRPAYRGFDAPDYSSSLLGFRCARPE